MVRGVAWKLEHPVSVGGLFRDRLHHVPMLDDLAVLELEDVDDGVAARAWLAHGVDVDDDVVAVREDAFDLAAIVRKLVLQEGNEALEALRSIRGAGIVLGVAAAEIFRRGIEILLVEDGVVERSDGFLVVLHLLGVGGEARTRSEKSDRGQGGNQHMSGHGGLLLLTSASHFRRQVERDDRKGNQNDEAKDIGDDERQYAVEDGRNLHILDHAFYHEDVHADRRMDEAEFDRHHDDDAEPDRIESKLFDHGKDDRDGEDDHGEHAVAPEPEPGEKLRHFLRRLGDGQEIAEQDGADQHREYRRGNARGLEQRPEDVLAGEPAAQHADDEGAAGAGARRFGRGEHAAIDAADDEGEQEQRRPDIAQRLDALLPGTARAGRQEAG